MTFSCPFLFVDFFFNIRDSGSNFNIVEFISLSYHDLHFLLIMIYILMNLELSDGLNWLISKLHGSIHLYPSCQYKGYRRTSASFYVDAGVYLRFSCLDIRQALYQWSCLSTLWVLYCFTCL